MRRLQRPQNNRLQLLITTRPVLEIVAAEDGQLVEVQASTTYRALCVVHAVGEREEAPDAAVVGVEGFG